MRQITKNFSDITAIDTNNLLQVEITVIEHNNPAYCFTVNDLPMKSQMYFDLLDSLHFRCKINNGAVEIAKISINGNEVLPIYQHLADPSTAWITGNWEFVINGPFYLWYHKTTGQGWTA
ncbi:MAG: hypothetical protein RJA11_908 [Bacteroidota bacterium]|jgi:hypothetical protein